MSAQITRRPQNSLKGNARREWTMRNNQQKEFPGVGVNVLLIHINALQAILQCNNPQKKKKKRMERKGTIFFLLDDQCQ